MAPCLHSPAAVPRPRSQRPIVVSRETTASVDCYVVQPFTGTSTCHFLCVRPPARAEDSFSLRDVRSINSLNRANGLGMRAITRGKVRGKRLFHVEHYPACNIEKAYHYPDTSSLAVGHASRCSFIGATAVSRLLAFSEMNADIESHEGRAALQQKTPKSRFPYASSHRRGCST